MKSNMLRIVLFLSSALFGTGVLAANEITYGEPRLYGPGCPSGTASFSPSPDGTSFSVLFDQLTIEGKRRHNYKYCTMVVPVKVPKDHMVEIKTLDLRGFMNLAPLTWGGAGVYSRFIDSRGRVRHGGWKIKWQLGEFSDVFAESFRLKPVLKSFCGGTQYLVLDQFVQYDDYNRRPSQDNYVGLDSVDGAGSLVGQVVKKKCK